MNHAYMSFSFLSLCFPAVCWSIINILYMYTTFFKENVNLNFNTLSLKYLSPVFIISQNYWWTRKLICNLFCSITNPLIIPYPGGLNCPSRTSLHMNEGIQNSLINTVCLTSVKLKKNGYHLLLYKLSNIYISIVSNSAYPSFCRVKLQTIKCR